MSAQMPYGYYDRTDLSKKYEKHLFVAGAGLQSAELNEIQDYATNRLRSIADAIFKDGDIVRDARIVVDVNTGDVTAESGAVYVKGAVRGVVPRNFTVSTLGLVTVGIYLVESVVSALEDPGLLDPAAGTRNYQEPGASRLKVEAVWGYDGERTDADFFPVYVVEDGALRAKEAPPSLDGVTQAIARYDRDSSGGTYVVSGMGCTMLPDAEDGRQVYSIAEGRCRVRGFGVEFNTSTRLAIDPTPDLRFIDSEPQTSTTAGAQRVDLDRYPVKNITQVRITAEKTETLTHGAFAGALDQIPDSSVLSIVSVVQGGTTYIQGTDYKLTSGKVDWSLAGAEVATGSTYQVTYRYITSVVPTAVDSSGCTVTGAVVGSLIMVSYNQSLPRIDRICVSDEGEIIYIKGVSADWNPRSPDVPENLLPLATINQTWDAARSITTDGVRVVSMPEIAQLSDRLDYVLGLVAQQRLESDINLREAGAKKGLFTDPFLDDSQRDQGIAQTGAVFDGELQLPIDAAVSLVDNRGANGVSFLNKTDAVSVQQLSRTGSMLVNPYMAFDPIPAEVALSPSVDRWVDVQTTWNSPVTRSIVVAFFSAGWLSYVQSVTQSNTLLSSQTRVQANLRQIEVNFTLSGFGPNETLTGVTFDGIPVTAVAQ